MHAVAASWSHNQTTLPETEDTVHRALLASRIRVALSGHDGGFGPQRGVEPGREAAGLGGGHGDSLGGGEWARTPHREGHEMGTGVKSVAWSPDGKRLASGSSDTVNVWEAGSGAIVCPYQARRGHQDRGDSGHDLHRD